MLLAHIYSAAALNRIKRVHPQSAANKPYFNVYLNRNSITSYLTPLISPRDRALTVLINDFATLLSLYSETNTFGLINQLHHLSKIVHAIMKIIHKTQESYAFKNPNGVVSVPCIASKCSSPSHTSIPYLNLTDGYFVNNYS